jgi:hypothetical protein
MRKGTSAGICANIYDVAIKASSFYYERAEAKNKASSNKKWSCLTLESDPVTMLRTSKFQPPSYQLSIGRGVSKYQPDCRLSDIHRSWGGTIGRQMTKSSTFMARDLHPHIVEISRQEESDPCSVRWGLWSVNCVGLGFSRSSLRVCGVARGRTQSNLRA